MKMKGVLRKETEIEANRKNNDTKFNKYYLSGILVWCYLIHQTMIKSIYVPSTEGDLGYKPGFEAPRNMILDNGKEVTCFPLSRIVFLSTSL